MAAIKFFLCFILAIAIAGATDVDSKPTKQLMVAPVNLPKDKRAFVISSNLPSSDQIDLANSIQSIYNSVSSPLTRATQFQAKLDSKYRNRFNNAIINYTAAAFYQKYFIILGVNGDVVLGFGL